MKMKKAILATVLTAACAFAFAQGDSPTHRGQPTRTGTNASITEPGPGVSNLRWWYPLQSSVGNDVITDNATANYAELFGTWNTPAIFEESPDWFGSSNIPYRYSFVVAQSASSSNETAGATAAAQFTLNGVPGNYYALYVWFPSSGTYVGGVLAPNADYAVYRIDYGNGQSFVDIVPHLGGGYWARLGYRLNTGQSRIFRMGSSGQIRITLYNTVPRDENGVLMGSTTNRIVCADAALAVPSPGQVYASPVVKNVGPGADDTIVVNARNESRVDPNDASGTLEIQAGMVSALNAAGLNISFPRWTWSPNIIANYNLAFDNTHPAFSADLGWTDPGAAGAPGYYGTNYLEAPVTTTYPGTANARWIPTLDDGKYYDIYVWFPGNGNGKFFAREARYVVRENGINYEFFVNQEIGAQWVRLGNRPFQHVQINGGLRVEVWDYSDDPADVGRFVAADAVMFVGSYASSILSTPTIANVRVRKDSGVVEPTEVVIVCAEDGRIYCLDARGNPNGTTTLYWAYPSIPDNNDPSWTDPNDTIDGPAGNRIPWPGSFGVSSPVVVSLPGQDIVVIAAENGRIYAIDCTGRGDYNTSTAQPGTTQRVWTWPKATYINGNLSLDPARPPFVGSVAYDPVTGQIFAGGTEGRLFALSAEPTGNQVTTLNWSYPPLTSNTIGAISSTPAIGAGLVYFTSFDGRLYARPTNGTSAGAWTYPDTSMQPLQPFRYTSPAFVSALHSGWPTDLVYVVNENGTMYTIEALTGTVLSVNTELLLSAGAQSSPYFTRLVPSGTAITANVITVGTLDGRFLAFYANPGQTNSAGTKLAWGWQSRGDTVFASPAVSRGWMYHAGVDGYLYSYSTGGQISVDPGFNPPGQQIDTPDSGNPDYDFVELKFLFPADYVNLRQAPPVGDPAAMPDRYPPPTRPALEWGERIYLVAYNFPYPASGNPPTVRFEIRGAGGVNIRFDRQAQLVTGKTPGDIDSGFATVGIPINATGQNFLTPGDNLTVNATIIDGGTQYSPPTASRLITVAHPLAVATVENYIGAPPALKSVGWTTNPSDPENLQNGNPSTKVLVSSAGEVGHAQSGSRTMYVTDRSRMIELTGSGITGVRAIRTDGAWRGGSAAVVKPLPYLGWEQLPEFIPNYSLDYPDVDRGQIEIIKDPFGFSQNPLFQPTQLRAPSNFDPDDPLSRILEGVPFVTTWNMQRYQPANLSTIIDTAGDVLDAGYLSTAYIYVDSNNNGRPDGIERTLAGGPPASRAEAYRTVFLGASVPIDEKMSIAEPTVDLGSLPHSLGYTPVAPWLPANAFFPDISTGAPYQLFFKPFTLRNEGNVNMLDLRIAKRIGQLPGPGYYPVGFSSPANDPLAWLDGWPNLVSNIDPRYAPDLGAYDFGGNPRVTMHKARVGDRAATILTVPDVPYGTTPLPNSQPVIGLAVPLGFPVGDYQQLVNVVEDNFLIGGQHDEAIMLDQDFRPLEAYSDPTMTLRFLNRETRVTGGVTTGTVPHVDDPLGIQTNFTWTNTAPSIVRDQSGNVHLAWHANRPQVQNTPATQQYQDNWNLFHSVMRGVTPNNAPPEAGTSPYRDLMGWIPTPQGRFWNTFAGPEPSTAPSTLFSGTPGTVVGNPKFTEPSFPVNALFGQTSQNFLSALFWTGSALKDATGNGVGDYVDNRIFFRTYTMNFGGVTPSMGEVGWIIKDNSTEKKRIRPLMLDSSRYALFWYSEVNGRSEIYQSVMLNSSLGSGDQTNNWSNPINFNPGQGFVGAWSPVPMLRTNAIDLVFTGMLKDARQSEIYYAKLNADNLGRIRDIANQPERNREALFFDSQGNFYRSRGVNWNTRRPIEVWIRHTTSNTPPFRIDIPATREEDDRTGVISSDTTLGGKVYMDPHTGVLRFTGPGPNSASQIELRYTPRVVRVSELGNAGGHAHASSFLDERNMWDRQYLRDQNNNAVANTTFVPVNRMWHIYERGASGPGQSKRPYMKTQRLMLRLTFSPALDANGNLIFLNVTGATSFYQADPGNRRVYFSLPDEGRQVSVTYQYRDNNGNLQTRTDSGFVVWQTEMSERPVPIEQAVDEGSVFACIDPFQSSAVEPRAGLIWVTFTSTRAGSRDIYYITLSPKLGVSN